MFRYLNKKFLKTLALTRNFYFFALQTFVPKKSLNLKTNI